MAFFRIRGYRILPNLGYHHLSSRYAPTTYRSVVLAGVDFKFRKLLTTTTPKKAADSDDRQDSSSSSSPSKPKEGGNAPAETQKNNSLEGKKSEDAIDRRVYPIAASTFMMGMAVGVVIPVTPLFVQSLGLSITELGFVLSTMGLVRILFSIPIASLGDIAGRRPLLIYGPMVTGLSIAGTGLCTTFWGLVGCRSFSGVGSSIQMAGAQNYLADISTPRNRARTMAPFQQAWAAGGAFGPFIGGYFANQYGLAMPFFIVGGVTISVALVNAIFLPETNPLPIQKGPMKETAKKVWQNMKTAVIQWGSLIKSPEIFPVTFLHTMFWTTASACQFTLLPLLAGQQFQISATEVGFMFTLFPLLTLLLSQPAAHLSDKVGRKYAIIPGAFLSSSAICLLTQATASTYLYPILVWGIGNTLMQGSTSAYVVDRTDVTIRGQALAMLRTGGDIGLFLGAFFGGALAENFGLQTTMLGSGAALALSALYFLIQSRKPRKINLPSPKTGESRVKN